MALRLSVIPHRLQFKFDARTSRGALQTHRVYYLQLHDTDNPPVTGIGECAPLSGLSLDARPELEPTLRQLAHDFASNTYTDADVRAFLQASFLQEWPSIRFGLETALLDLRQGGKRRIFDHDFSQGKAGIPINGLIWMGDKTFMQEQIQKKLEEGYTCLKLKIGSLDFSSELEILQSIREVAGPDDLTIRVDANGAFAPEEAYRKLERLARYDLHSIEQPIRQGQLEQMRQLCAHTPIPIALDEELIGVQGEERQKELLDLIQPQYIILKPTLVGGLQASADWIALAAAQGIGWWMTSALESNIGLNAISQFTANYPVTMPQGLGTGQLYHNNITSPLQIRAGWLWYGQGKWGDLPEEA
jgi:o-succinylbenzoate synthase